MLIAHMQVVLAVWLTGFLLGVAVFATASPMLAAALLEAPPRAPLPGVCVVLALCWSIVFAGAAGYVGLTWGELGVAGVLGAAAEVAGAAAIWFHRANSSRGGGGDGPAGPSGPTLPEDYWQRWEDDFRQPPLPR